MKILFVIAGICIFAGSAFSQPTPTPTPDRNFQRPYYVQKATLHKLIQRKKGSIVFIGDSITDGNEWSEQLNCPLCRNRGISGDISHGVLARLDDVLAERPAKIFLMIGVNDASRYVPNDEVIANYREFVRRTQATSPGTRIYLQSVLPVNANFRKFADRLEENIVILNKALSTIAMENKNVTYIDLYTRFLDADGRLDKRYTNDGLHLLGEGYVLWAKVLTEGGYLK